MSIQSASLYFAAATRKYIEANLDLEGKGFDPRKLLKSQAMRQYWLHRREKMKLFSSVDKA